MSKFDEFRRHLGLKKTTVTLDAVMDLLGDAWRWVEDRVSEPAIRMRQLGAQREKLAEFITEDRSLATERALIKGTMLLRLRAFNGPAGWDQELHFQGICRRTAQNLIALALFAKISPDVFERLKRLGPTKLYRLARIELKAVSALHLDAEVPTERGTVKLRNLTDRELQAYLRRVAPPRTRTTQEKIRKACGSMRRIIENLPPQTARTDLELMRDVLRDASSRVVNLLAKPS